MSAHLGRIILVQLVTPDTICPIMLVWPVALAEVHVKPVQQLHHGGMALLVLNVLAQATVIRDISVAVVPVWLVKQMEAPHVVNVLSQPHIGMARPVKHV